MIIIIITIIITHLHLLRLASEALAFLVDRAEEVLLGLCYPLFHRLVGGRRRRLPAHRLGRLHSEQRRVTQSHAALRAARRSSGFTTTRC